MAGISGFQSVVVYGEPHNQAIVLHTQQRPLLFHCSPIQPTDPHSTPAKVQP